MGALLYRDEHDVAHAYDTTQQGEDAYYPDGRGQYAHCLLRLDVVAHAVTYPYGSRIIGVEAVDASQHAAVAALKVEVALLVIQSACGEEEVVQLVALVVDGLSGGKGHVGSALPLVAHVAVDAHHLEGEGSHVDELSHGVSMELLEQGLC